MAIFVCAWTAIAVAIGIMASKRGRVGYGWFLLALVISPLIVGPLVLALPRQYADPQRETATGGAGAIFKWFGITILFGGLTFVVMMLLALFLIVQHGGA